MGSSAFSRKKVFFQKKSTVLRTSQYICVAETEIMRNKKNGKKKIACLKLKWKYEQQRRDKKEPLLLMKLLCPIESWQVLISDHTSDPTLIWSHSFHLITHLTLIWSHIQVSHKREHHTQNEPFCDHVNLFYILDPRLNLRKRKLAFKWPLSVSKHAEQIFIQNHWRF